MKGILKIIFPHEIINLFESIRVSIAEYLMLK